MKLIKDKQDRRVKMSTLFGTLCWFSNFEVSLSHVSNVYIKLCNDKSVSELYANNIGGWKFIALVRKPQCELNNFVF